MSTFSSEQDTRLAELLDRLVRRAATGQAVDIEAVAGEHPDIAQELRSLWATMQFTSGFLTLSALKSGTRLAKSSPADANDGGAVHQNPVAAGLPRRFGDYELIEELGRGGMGVVYRARQPALNRIVALKLILRGELASAEDRDRFRAEATSAAQLTHPNVVPVYEVGEAEGQPFFSMQFVEGETLAQRVAVGPLEPKEAAELLVPVCRAIAAAHRWGVLHRDLKPSNILIDAADRPFVTDFGLAKRISPTSMATQGSQERSLRSITQSGAVLGTPGYMAPEQAAGDRGQVGPATDVYSLGAVLYAMLTGRAPFQAASPIDAVLMVLEQDPPPPRLLNPQVDSDLEMIALKALQKPTDLRYSTADELADDLECFLRNEPVSARSSHFSQVLSRAFRPTHHAAVLESWGRLWMLHSVVVLLLCLVTNWMQLRAESEATRVQSGAALSAGSVKSKDGETPESLHSTLATPNTPRWPYLMLWTVGLGAWARIFWELRRRAGPVTFVERQIAHVWAASIACSTGLFIVEWLMGLPALTLSPVLALIAGAVFVAKAGILSGEFYIHATLMFLTAIPMSLYPRYSVTMFGLMSFMIFFWPGWKFDRMRRCKPTSSRHREPSLDLAS
ncbi:MAG: serine/threonine-protein kinase [Planctomycetaceae bacterium]